VEGEADVELAALPAVMVPQAVMLRANKSALRMAFDFTKYLFKMED
jgi:hypothetical protein